MQSKPRRHPARFQSPKTGTNAQSKNSLATRIRNQDRNCVLIRRARRLHPRPNLRKRGAVARNRQGVVSAPPVLARRRTRGENASPVPIGATGTLELIGPVQAPSPTPGVERLRLQQYRWQPCYALIKLAPVPDQIFDLRRRS
jgi:hypothetical protein